MTARAPALLAALGQPALAGDSDADLLRRYAADRDEAAFAELVRRYGRLVWRTARTAVGPGPAEDVFQVAFLALARSAGSVRRPDALAGWLHRTARRAAARIRRADSRPLPPPPVRPSDDPLDRITARELLLAVDEEIAALPDALRAPLLLCAVDGLSQDEAARRLGWSAGSVRGRLERARARLRQRLEARGLAVPSVLLTAAAVPPGLEARVLEAGRGEAVSPAVDELVAEVTRMSPLLWRKTILALSVAVGGLAAIGWMIPGGVPAPILRAAPDSPRLTAPRASVEPLILWSTPLRPDDEPEDPPVKSENRLLLIGSTAFVPDGKHVLTGGLARPIPKAPASGEIQERDAATGKVVRTYRGDVSYYTDRGLAVSPDGKTLAAAGQGLRLTTSVVEVWDRGAEKPRHRLNVRGYVSGLTFSPDGRTLVAGWRGEVCAWDVATGNELFRVQVNCGGLAFHPGGKVVAAAEYPGPGGIGRVVFLDAATGRERGMVKMAGRRLSQGLAFSSDGKRLASSVYVPHAGPPIPEVPAVVLWDVTVPPTGDVAIGEPRDASARMPTDKGICQLAFTPDGSHLVTVAEDGAVRAFDPATGQLVADAREHTGQVFALTVSPNGKRLVTAGLDAVKGWSVPTLLRQKPTPPAPGKLVRWSAPMRDGRYSWEQFLTARAGVWTPDGRYVLTAGWSLGEKVTDKAVTEVRVWDAADGRLVHTFRGGKTGPRDSLGPNSHLAISPDGKTVAAGGERMNGKYIEQVVEVWDWGQEKPRLTLDGFRNHVHAVAFAPDGKTLIAADHRGGVLLAWDPATGKQLYQVLQTGWPWAIAFHPAGTVYATANHAEGVRFVDPATGKTRGTYRPPGLVGGVSSVAFSPDGKSVAVVPVRAADEDLPQIVIFDVAVPAAGDVAATNPRSIPRTAGWASHVAFSPDGKYLAAGCPDGAVQVYNPTTGRRVAAAKEHTNSVRSVQFSPDGTRLLSVGRDAVKVWTVAELLKPGKGE